MSPSSPVLIPATSAVPAPLSVRELPGAELVSLVPAWEDLAAAALEPNVFYEPWLFLPALRAFGAGRDLRLVVVESAGRVAGFFPLERRRLGRRLPLGVLGSWRHPHCYVGTPLVRAGEAGRCLDALFQWLASNPRGSSLIEWDHVTADGPFRRHLQDTLVRRRLPSFVRGQWTRAFLRVGGGGDACLRSGLSGRRRRVLARRRRRLEERGQVGFEVLGPDDDVEAWTEAFLACEAGGWKGREGTAMACGEADRRFFRDATVEAFRRRRLVALTLAVDGRPIALCSNFLAGGGAFAFKTAFDEQFARFSPGVLLEVDLMRRLHDRRDVCWMDSCTAADNDTLNGLWPDRRTLTTTLAATGRAPGGVVVSLLPALRAIKRAITSFSTDEHG
jgi:CelD/BcsL family acetyltransferase involved in cellulose biosynthesis